jgi:hypothetical protein
LCASSFGYKLLVKHTLRFFLFFDKEFWQKKKNQSIKTLTKKIQKLIYIYRTNIKNKMSEEMFFKKSDNGATSYNVQNLQDKLTSLKREAYSNLAQALDLDAQTNESKKDMENVIVLYEKSLMLIERGLVFFRQHENELSVLEGK